MKQTWTLFVSGIFFVLFVGFAVSQGRAQSEKDDKVGLKHIEDASISGVQSPVPPIANLDVALQAKEKQMEEEKARISEAEERLAAEEARLKLRIAELEKIETQIVSSQQANAATNEKILKKMVKTFETMAPKKASAVFMNMKDELAVEIFLNLKEKKLAAILEVMDSARATQLSSLMSKRRPAGLDIGVQNEGAISQGKGSSQNK
jgi:flagellar motility protein MotE (MotC chaperone)